MVSHTAEIDPSPSDREVIRKMLKEAYEKSKSRVEDAEVFLKENKKVLDDEQKQEAEKELTRFRRNSETLEDALAKSENTKGRTLKKVFAKKTLTIVKDNLPEEDHYAAFEKVLHANGLA